MEDFFQRFIRARHPQGRDGRRPAAAGTGLALFGAVMLSVPSAGHLADMQALNRELGKLCSNPPNQARTVCRLHARLVNTLGFG